MGVFSRIGRSLSHAWNAFVNLDRTEPQWSPAAYGNRPDRTRFKYTGEKSIISSIYTRIAIDVAAVKLEHVKLDDEGRYSETVKSGLNNCLNVEANIDQPATMFRRDAVMTMFDLGTIALSPIDTTLNPNISGGYDILTLRVGRITEWRPQHVKVELYNELTGRREEVVFGKGFTGIVENPFYNVMNEPSSTLQRLSRKLTLLDAVDEASASGKLDIIIQLPYVIKSTTKRIQAEQRRTDIEMQLKGSKYGIAYADGTEKITQLNRPAENNLMKQVEYLTELLYSQLGITKSVMDGTASEAEMNNYYERTIKPILVALVEEMNRKFLTKTARTQGQTVMFFRDVFALISMADLPEVIDKFTRNEVLTSNEGRQIVGFKPVKDKKADTLRNSNMPEKDLGIEPPAKNPAIRATAQRLDMSQAITKKTAV